MSQPNRRGPRPGPRPDISPEGQAIAAQYAAEREAMTEDEKRERNVVLDLAIREADRG